MATNDFMKMSATLEMHSALLHEFIGGHMVTSGCAYDPVFYAVHAFIDLLWDKWQQRSTVSASDYPIEYINVTMLPFNLRPADVIDSRTQLCVAYMNTETVSEDCRDGTKRQRAQNILEHQSIAFLTTIPRTCHAIHLPSALVTRNLMITVDAPLVDLPVLESEFRSSLASNVCFDVDVFANSTCPCDKQVATCKVTLPGFDSVV